MVPFNIFSDKPEERKVKSNLQNPVVRKGVRQAKSILKVSRI